MWSSAWIRAEVHVQCRQKIKKRQQYFCTKLQLKYIRTWKNTTKQNIDSMQKHTYWLGWKLPIHYTTQNILSIWNQQPSHISKQKFKSTIICWEPKNKQHKKIKQLNQKPRQKFRYICWGKNIQHLDTEKRRSTLKFTKPNHSSHQMHLSTTS